MLNPFGLLALLALPAIVGIHLYRNRQRTVVVTGLFLYGPEARSLASGRTRRPLVWRTSLWLELLAALALAWWLCDIRLGDLARVHHAVVVLDTRLRLSARHDGVAVSERLRKELDARIAALSADDRVTVIASGEPPRLLAGPAAEPIAARKALAKWSADSGWHDLDAALGLAAELAEGSGEITLVSDRIPERLPNAIGVLAGGRSAATSGLAEVRRFPDRVAVRVYASGAKAERIVVLRSAAGELAEHLVEDVAEAGAAEVEAAGLRAATVFEGGVAVTVIGRALLVVLEDFVGLAHVLELGFRGGVAGVAVRVVLHGELAVRLFQVVRGCVAGGTKGAVVVGLGHARGSSRVGEEEGRSSFSVEKEAKRLLSV